MLLFRLASGDLVDHSLALIFKSELAHYRSLLKYLTTAILVIMMDFLVMGQFEGKKEIDRD